MSNLRSMAVLAAALCSEPADAMPEKYQPLYFSPTKPEVERIYVDPVTEIDEKCRKEALKTYDEVMDTIMSHDFLIGSHLIKPADMAKEVREECLDNEVAEYCATTGDMKYMEVIREFGVETDITIAQAAHIADEAQALCTDEMNVNLGILKLAKAGLIW